LVEYGFGFLIGYVIGFTLLSYIVYKTIKICFKLITKTKNKGKIEDK